MIFPALGQLHEIEPVFTRTVSSDLLDLNGHMNAARFFAAHVGAVRESLAGSGVTEEYVASRRMGTFAVGHYLRYLSELREGDTFSVRVRFLERTDKAIHAMPFLVNESAGRLANMLEVIVVHVDQITRRATGVPDDIAERLDARILVGNSIDWTVLARLALRRKGRSRA